MSISKGTKLSVSPISAGPCTWSPLNRTWGLEPITSTLVQSILSLPLRDVCHSLTARQLSLIGSDLLAVLHLSAVRDRFRQFDPRWHACLAGMPLSLCPLGSRLLDAGHLVRERGGHESPAPAPRLHYVTTRSPRCVLAVCHGLRHLVCVTSVSFYIYISFVLSEQRPKKILMIPHLFHMWSKWFILHHFHLWKNGVTNTCLPSHQNYASQWKWGPDSRNTARVLS